VSHEPSGELARCDATNSLSSGQREAVVGKDLFIKISARPLDEVSH
jgi:hypothetical protein